MSAPLPAVVSIGTPPKVYHLTADWLTLHPQGKAARRYPIYTDNDGGEVVAAWLVQECPERDRE